MSKTYQYCNNRIVFLLQDNNGRMTRGTLRDSLLKEGYGKYCIYEALRRLSMRGKIIFKGSGHSKNQIILLTESKE